MIVFENRASVILYKFLLSNDFRDGCFLLPANICYIVPLTFLKAGVNFYFIDISKDHYCINEKIVNKIIESNTYNVHGVLFARTYGIELDFSHIFKKWKNLDQDIQIIDDKCLCKPKFHNELNDSNVSLELYSTGYAKNVDLGFGGFGVTEHYIPNLSTRLSYDKNSLRNIERHVYDSLKANTQFNYLDNHWLDLNDFSRDINKYKNEVEKEIKTSDKQKLEINNIFYNEIHKRFHFRNSYNKWRFNIILNNSEYVLEKIFNSGLFASSHYKNIAMIFKDRTIPRYDNFDNTSNLSNKIINLFNYKYIDTQMAYKICSIINNYAT